MTRRFIAGAVCPRCGEMDKLVVDSERQLRECVGCGFADERPEDDPAELPTRVTRGTARLVETPSERVTLIDPAKPATGTDSGS